MFIAQLSDPHITAGPLAAEPAAGLQRALGRVLGLDPLPDCVIVTGDLVDHGRPDEYAALREVIGGFPLPLHLAIGNHDNREQFVSALGAETRYTVEYPEVTLVVLDSNVPGTDGGKLGDDQLSWLDDALTRRPDVPAMVCLHHPPIPVGIPFLDEIRLADGEGLAEVIAAHRQVTRVLAGHLHRVVSAAFGGSVLSVAPSTYRQCELALRADRQIGFVHEPTGLLLHALTGTDCVTHTVAVSHAAALSGAY